MEVIVAAIQKTPIPTILILAGLFFLLLGFVSKLGGMIEVSPEQKRLTLPIGLLVLTLGLLLTFIPSSSPKAPAEEAAVDAAKQPQSAIVQAAAPAVETPIASAPPTALPAPTKARTAEATPTPVDEETARKNAQQELLEREAKRKAAHRARWPEREFPAPNGGLLVYTLMPDGNPACASYDGANCLWGKSYDDIDFDKIVPLACGDAHYAQWKTTGYENPKHWCNLAR